MLAGGGRGEAGRWFWGVLGVVCHLPLSRVAGLPAVVLLHIWGCTRLRAVGSASALCFFGGGGARAARRAVH